MTDEWPEIGALRRILESGFWDFYFLKFLAFLYGFWLLSVPYEGLVRVVRSKSVMALIVWLGV